jgi:ABC-2 type transport system permease protein
MTAAPRTVDPSPQARPRSFLTLTMHQFRYEMLIFFRNRQSVFFTMALPVMFLLILASVFGHFKVDVPGGTINGSAYYVPGMIALGVISASFGNLATSVISSREAGILKRRRATPLPAAALIVARALVAVVIALAITVVLLAIGYAYGATIPARTAPAVVLDVIVGALAFCGLGYALASVIHSVDATQPIVLAITLPLYFISGVYVFSSLLPHWLLNVAAVFPVRHFATALLAAYNPHATGSGIRWVDLAVMAGWGAFGLMMAVRRFSWLPHHN